MKVKIGLDPKIEIKTDDIFGVKASGKSFAEATIFTADFKNEDYFSPLVRDGFFLKCTPVVSFTFWGTEYSHTFDEFIHYVTW